MHVPLKLLPGSEAEGGGSGAVPAPGVKIDELNSPHWQAFSHSLTHPDNLAFANVWRGRCQLWGRATQRRFSDHPEREPEDVTQSPSLVILGEANNPRSPRRANFAKNLCSYSKIAGPSENDGDPSLR
jgi:hypothetical protein